MSKDEQVDEKAEKEKCENEYNVLLECLDKYDRKWPMCQNELKTFRACYNESEKNNTIEKKDRKR
ncbi:conserved Plasmodium protein, unknown function [Plasmodium malariae]|uniref:CHCH domain-containing protein n=1 Tax=Plasmodium malariae TaxID=5858 RepID=A0A1C3KL57_PLAMA|nr:conserved Plasmodium protein, unknown function [Plasmodium malariae]